DGHRPVDDPARDHRGAAHAALVAQRLGLLALLRDVQVLDDHRAVTRGRLDDAALLAAVLAGEHLDGVALLHLHLCSNSHCYSTPGARLTIFMKFFSRSSRATGPKMRVPRGLR